MVDRAGQSRFFIGAAMSSAGWPCFGAVVGLAAGLVGADGLAIGGAVLTRSDVAVGFFWIIFVIGGNEPSKMLNQQCGLPGILLLRVAFSQNQIVKPW